MRRLLSAFSYRTSAVTMAWRTIGPLFAISMACVTAFSACAQQSSTFFADLAFHFDCKAGADPVSDQTVEQFLQGRGFKVLNVVQARRERKMDPMLSDLFIDGIDQQQRIIRFMAEPLTHGSYSVTLYTHPPTEHAIDLEDALLAFVSQTLICHVRQVARRENGLDAQGAYSDFFKKREDSFRQLEDWRRPPV